MKGNSHQLGCCAGALGSQLLRCHWIELLLLQPGQSQCPLPSNM